MKVSAMTRLRVAIIVLCVLIAAVFLSLLATVLFGYGAAALVVWIWPDIK